MGEYAMYQGEQIKIGTCEMMYYLRYEDRNKVTKLENSLDPAIELNLFWRLPYPEEDHLEPGSYESFKTQRLYKEEANGCIDFQDKETSNNPGTMQMYHNESGLLVNVSCYHGNKLPKGNEDFKPFWNGKGYALELAYIKNKETGIWPIVQCRFCKQMWSYKWEEILPYLHGELRTRLEKYAKQ